MGQVYYPHRPGKGPRVHFSSPEKGAREPFPEAYIPEPTASTVGKPMGR